MGVCKNCGADTSHGKCPKCGGDEVKKGGLKFPSLFGKSKKPKSPNTIATEDPTHPNWRVAKLVAHSEKNYGLTLRPGTRGKGAIVDWLAPGGPADVDKVIRVGDLVRCIQGTDVENMPFSNISTILNAAISPLEIEVFADPEAEGNTSPPNVGHESPTRDPGYVDPIAAPRNEAAANAAHQAANEKLSVSSAGSRPSLLTTPLSGSMTSLNVEDPDEKLRQERQALLNKNYIREDEIAVKPGVVPARQMSGQMSFQLSGAPSGQSADSDGIGYISGADIVSRPGVAPPRMFLPTNPSSTNGEITPQPLSEPTSATSDFQQNGAGSRPSSGIMQAPTTPRTPTENFRRYFIGTATPDTAAAILMQHIHPDGAFLVRESSRSKGDYVISVKFSNEVKHIPVGRDAEGYRISKSIAFATIPELVRYYQEISLNKHFSALNTTLCHSCGTIEFQ